MNAELVEIENDLSKVSPLKLEGFLRTVFSTLFKPALEQLGMSLGDYAKSFRIRNLIRISEKLDKVLSKRGLNINNLKSISLSVGLPLLEKASYQDDTTLQWRWAHLLASSMAGEGDEDDGFSLDITYIEILHQFSRLDCELLEYVSENGVSARNRETNSLIVKALDPNAIRQAFPGRLAHISLEKLVNLGCAYRILRAPLLFGEGDGYGPLAQDIMVTSIGLNLYTAATGKTPRWDNIYIDPEESEPNK